MTNDYSTEVQEVADAMNAVYENKQTNKKNSISGDFSSDNVSYPTVKAVKNEFGTKVDSWSNSTSDSNYPSEKLVKDSLDTKISKSQTEGLVKNDGTIDTTTYLSQHQDISGKENISNKVTSISASSTDTQYPSAKLLYDSLDEKISKSQTVGLVKNDGTIDTTVYLDTDNVDNVSNLTDGIYLLLEESSSSSSSTPASEMVLYFNDDDVTSFYWSNIKEMVEDASDDPENIDWSEYPVTCDDNIVTNLGAGYVDFGSGGEHVVRINWSNLPTEIILNIDMFTDTYCDKIVFPYGMTHIEGSIFDYCEVNTIEIPKTLKEFDDSDLDNEASNYILNWDNTNDIPALLEGSYFNPEYVETFSIPYGTTALYTAKDYPLEKLIEREQEASSTVAAVSELYIKKDGNVIEVMSKDDVEDLLDTKLDAVDTFSGSYDDLTNKPSIPTKTSDLTNDGDGTNAFLTEHQSLSNYIQKSNTNGLVKNDGTIDTTTKEVTTNKVTSWSNPLSDTNYPSEKLVKDTIDTKTITVEKQVTAESGYASTYVIKQNGSQVGVKINIDKDRMLRSASYETVGSTPTTEETTAGMSSGDKYIKLVVNTADSDSASNLILPITDIFDLQTADNTTLTLTNGVYAIKSGGVDTAQIKDGAVTSDKIASAVKSSWLSSSDVQSEISAFASALAEAINPSSP